MRHAIWNLSVFVLALMLTHPVAAADRTEHVQFAKGTSSTVVKGTIKGYDGVMFIGQHAMAGARNGVLAHSQSFNVKRIAINGKDVGEIGQAAAIAGYFGIPVIMLAGDEAACAEIQDLQPKAVTVAVKRLMGTNSTLSLSHTEAKRQIEQAAEKAVSQINNYTPWKITGPVEMTIEDLPQPPQHPTPRVQTYRGGTVLEAFEAWLGKP